MLRKIFTYMLSYIVLVIYVLDYLFSGYNLITLGIFFVFPMVYLMQSILSKSFFGDLLISFSFTTFMILIPMYVKHILKDNIRIILIFMLVCTIVYFIKKLILEERRTEASDNQ